MVNIKHLKLANYFIDKAYDAIDNIADGVDVEKNSKILQQVSDHVCNLGIPFVAYAYAERISAIVESEQKPLLNIPKLQKIVEDSNDEELIIRFADEVCGADLKSLQSHLPSDKQSKLNKEFGL